MATHSKSDEIEESEPLLSPTSPTSPTSPIPSKKEKENVWYKTASAYWLLPSFMLIAITNGLGITAKIQFYLRAVCYDYYSSKGHPLSVSFVLNPINDYPDEWCNNAEVQAKTAQFLLIWDLCSAIPAIFVLAPLGLLADIKGRKICLLIAITGSIFNALNILLVGNYIDTFGLYFLLVGALIEGITGGFLSLIAASYAYATDCTSPTQRSVIFGWMQGSFFVGFVGPMIGGWIIEMTNDLLSVFYIMFAIYVMTFLYFLFILPESLTKEKQLENLRRQQESNSTFDRSQLIKSWIIYSVFKPLTILFEKNGDNNSSFFTKYSLPILASINTLLTAAIMGIQAVFLLYVTLVFKWSLVDQGYYFLILGISRVVVLLILFPLLISKIKRYILNNVRNNQINIDNNSSDSDDEPVMVEEIVDEKQLRKYEIWILRLALLIDVFAYFGYGVATSSSTFVIATVIASLGTVSGSVIKSLQTNLVAPSQIGQLLGALSVLDSISRVISPVIFNALYSIFVVTSPNLIWYGVALPIAAACLLSFGLVPK